MSKNRADFPPSTRPLQPLRVFGKKDKRLKAEIKAKLNAGRFGAIKSTTAVASTVPTTRAAPTSEETTTTSAASTTTTIKAPKTTEAITLETSSASKTTAATNITVLADKITVTSTTPSEESGEIAQDEELSMELPEMAVAEIDEETLSNSLSKDIRRAPAREEFPDVQTGYDALICIITRF